MIPATLAEQTTPEQTSVIDTIAYVSNLRFIGMDIDLYELGGTVGWIPPPSTHNVMDYRVYFATSAVGASRAELGGSPVAVGINELFLPENTPIRSYTHFLVYTESILGEQTTPVAHVFVDAWARLGPLGFRDERAIHVS